MRTFHSAYDLDNYPRLAAVVKTLAVCAVAGVFAAAWATAGPGNGSLPVGQWAAVHRPDVARITLPTVVITAQRANAADKVASVGCAKGA